MFYSSLLKLLLDFMFLFSNSVQLALQIVFFLTQSLVFLTQLIFFLAQLIFFLAQLLFFLSQLIFLLAQLIFSLLKVSFWLQKLSFSFQTDHFVSVTPYSPLQTAPFEISPTKGRLFSLEVHSSFPLSLF
eukprot:TRINITY_DN9978_c0_g1_i1.p1 TRINITY_DN9978_c0_g1~~TRINITY_DN9978_c0_g1_i1.p1  ORF type:complete len:130 (-),score=12.04 TRINITY_DN9978_c0_g1_i1:166-555(-)